MVTALPLVEGKINLTTGTHSAGPSKIIHCEVDGTITINWRRGGTFVGYAMAAGDDRILPDEIESVVITAGTFTLG